MSEVPTRADVVVIGAGIMGLSTAFNLAKLGVNEIISSLMLNAALFVFENRNEPVSVKIPV